MWKRHILRLGFIAALVAVCAACSSSSDDLPRYNWPLTFIPLESGPGVLAEDDGCLYFVQGENRYLLVLPPDVGDWDGQTLRIGDVELQVGDTFDHVVLGSGPPRDDPWWNTPPPAACDSSRTAAMIRPAPARTP